VKFEFREDGDFNDYDVEFPEGFDFAESNEYTVDELMITGTDHSTGTDLGRILPPVTVGQSVLGFNYRDMEGNFYSFRQANGVH